MQFTALRRTIDGLYLLKCSEPARFDQPIALCTEDGTRVGKLVETIGRVSSPLYLATSQGKELEGIKLTPCTQESARERK